MKKVIYPLLAVGGLTILTNNGGQLWTETDVTGPWVLGTYKSTLDGAPFRKALDGPIVITDYAAAHYR